MEQNWDCWTVDLDDAGVCTLTLDVPRQSQNTLSQKVLEEFEGVMETLESKSPAGLILASGKPSGFIVGADVYELSQLSEDAIFELARRGHKAIDRLEKLSCPTVAEINGLCVGGGLEIALACDFRIAAKTSKFGFPEVQLGLHPGLGGTYRLPRTIAGPEALKLMLTGKTLDASEAKKIELIDEVVEERHLEKAVAAALKSNDSHGPLAKVRKSVELSRPARLMMARAARQKTEERAPREHYPAPHALLELFEEHGGDRSMLEHEAKSFAALAQTQAARNLIRLFKLRDRLKREARVGGRLGIKRVHVIGAGTMGGDIAAWAALHGFETTLEDIDRNAIAGAIKRASALFKDRTPRNGDLRAPMDRLIPDEGGRGAAVADLILEAAPEKEDVKGEIYKKLSGIVRPDAVIATNTSSIPLETLSEYFADPARLVGLHFFNPVAKLPLVEVVRGEATGEKAFSRARAFAERLDKLPLPVKSTPGFLVNRVLTPYLLEAVRLMDEGVAPETIDKAAEDFGMRQGPVEVADNVGLDICLQVGEILADKLGGEVEAPPPTLKRKVEGSKLGRKSGEGFYTYKRGKPQKSDADAERAKEIQDRLLRPLFEGSLSCLTDRVVADGDLLDAGVVFGAGFAPFRGGPARHLLDERDDELHERFVELEKKTRNEASAA